MGFRTLEINKQAEIHIKEGQLEVTTEDGIAIIPIEDLSILSLNKVAITTLDDRFLPTAIVLPFEGHSRQSKLMHAQVAFSEENYLLLWKQIINRKIDNQARFLSILGKEGADVISNYLCQITDDTIDLIESSAAKQYFSYYHEGLNRRGDDPVNSRLNYGYAVVRSSIARNLVATGFHPTFGIHHNSQLNAFNLADDLIEPYRAIVDAVAYKNFGNNAQLSKNERREIASVLHNAFMVNGTKINVLSAIELMCESL